MGSGIVAYEAYRKVAGGRSLVSGQKLPEFNELSAQMRLAWQAVEEAVYEEFELSTAASVAEKPVAEDPNQGHLTLVEEK